MQPATPPPTTTTLFFVLCVGQFLGDLGLAAEAGIRRAAQVNDIGRRAFVAAQARPSLFLHAVVGVIEQLVIAHQLPRHCNHIGFAGGYDLFSFGYGRYAADNGNGNMYLGIGLDLLRPFHIVAMRQVECLSMVYGIYLGSTMSP